MVRREGDRVLVEGLGGAKWGGYSPKQDTPVGALEAILAATSKAGLDYDFIAGVSGAAFRTQVQRDKWHPAQAYSTVGFDCVAAFVRNVGGTLRWLGRDEAKQAAVLSIDSGVPALLNREECSVVAGYRDHGNVLVIRETGAGDEGYKDLVDWTRPADKAPFSIGIVHLPERIDRPAVVRKALEQAVALADSQSAGELVAGFTALQLWIDQLEDDARYAGENYARGCEGNGYSYNMLDAERRSAGKFLRSVAGELGPDAAAHLAKAAALYEREPALMETKRPDLPEPWNLFPWDLDNGKKWTNDMRHAQARVMRELLALEKEAVGEIRAALASARR